MKRSCLFLLVFVFSTIAYSETIYYTFPKKAGGEVYSKERLALIVNEIRVPIADLLLVDAANRDPRILAHPGGRRQYFIIVDLLHLNANQALEVRNLVQQFAAMVPREDLIALGTINHEAGLRFYSGLTADRSKLIAGWNAIGKIAITGMTEGPEGNIYPAEFPAEEKLPALIADQEFISNLKKYAISSEAREEFGPLYVQSLVDVVSLFTTVPGRKHLILFSSKAEVKGLKVNLEELSKPPEEKEEQTREEQDRQRADRETEAAIEHKTLRDLTTQGARTRESIEAENQQQLLKQRKGRQESDVNVVSKLMQGLDGHVHAFLPSSEESGFLKDLAAKTGGSYNEFKDFLTFIPQLLQLDHEFYVLSWNGELKTSFHELHTIDLKHGDRAVEIPARWLAPKPFSDYTLLEKRMRLSQVIYKDFGSSNHHHFWADIVLDEGMNRICSFSQVDGESLIAAGSSKLDLEFYGFFIEQDGTIVDFSRVPITLDLNNPKLTERLQKAGLKIWNVLFSRHQPGVSRSIVYNATTGEFMAHSADIQFGDSQLMITNPFFPSVNFDWILWPKPDEAMNRRGHEILYPYRVGANIFTPELAPKVQAQEKGKVIYFKMYNFTPSEKYPHVRLRFVSANGSSTEIEQFQLMQQPRLIQRGGLEVFWTIPNMPLIASGTYRFQIDVMDKTQGKEVIRDVITTVD